MLLDWRDRCPRLNGEFNSRAVESGEFTEGNGADLFRVFPSRGKRQPWPKPRRGGGGPLLYSNYRVQSWNPFLRRLELPEVTPHSARHSYISTLQAAGIEVAMVAKLAGHANPATTLGVYSHAIARGEMAAALLEKAYTHRDERDKDSVLDLELASAP
jgi:integrase